MSNSIIKPSDRLLLDKPFSHIINYMIATFSGLVIKNSYGEIGLYYNPDNTLPRGKYIATFKECDGENDKGSQLNRENVAYRLNLKISKETFKQLFDEEKLPSRPAKGNIITYASGKKYYPTKIDTVMPHPVYGWMSWICVIDPSKTTFEDVIEKGLFQESYDNALSLYSKVKSVN